MKTQIVLLICLSIPGYDFQSCKNSNEWKEDVGFDEVFTDIENNEDCECFEESWKIAECASAKIRQGDISEFQFKSHLVTAMEKTGVKLNFAKEPQLIINPVSIEGPAVLIAKSDFSHLMIPEFYYLEHQLINKNGSDKFHTIYRMSSVHRIKVDCDHVLDNVIIKEFVSRNATTLVIDPIYDCVDVLRTKFTVIKGDLGLMESEVDGVNERMLFYLYAEVTDESGTSMYGKVYDV